MTEETIFVSALDKRTPADRSAYLDEACAGDAVLRQRVEVLLKAHDDAGAFLDRPAVEQIAACGPQSQDSAEAIAESQARANPSETQAERPTGGGDGPSLDFLTPSQNPGSLGRLSHYEA